MSAPAPGPRRVVITGATGDIGRATARAFARTGAALGLVGGKNPAALDALVAELAALPEPPFVARAQVDLLAPTGVRDQVAAVCARLVSDLGGVDCLVALAGLPAVPELWNKSFADVAPEDLHAAFAVDTVGTFLFAQALAPALKRTHGSIVVMSSSAAFYGDVWGLAYAPAKSANMGLVRMLARVLAPEVRVNGIAPGGIESAWLASLSDDGKAHAAAASLLGRLGTPDEVAEAIVRLASPGYLNGQILAFDGGIFPAGPPPA